MIYDLVFPVRIRLLCSMHSPLISFIVIATRDKGLVFSGPLCLSLTLFLIVSTCIRYIRALARDFDIYRTRSNDSDKRSC